MSDDTKAAEAEQKAAEAANTKVEAEAKAKEKTYPEDVVKELIADRDKLKAKLRGVEEKEKKESEQKAIEEGRIKEVLAQKEQALADAQKRLDAITARDAEARKRALEKVTDPALKKFAEKFETAEEILDFVETVAKQKPTTHSALAPRGANGGPAFKSPADYLARGQREGWSI